MCKILPNNGRQHKANKSGTKMLVNVNLTKCKVCTHQINAKKKPKILHTFGRIVKFLPNKWHTCDVETEQHFESAGNCMLSGNCGGIRMQIVIEDFLNICHGKM